MSATSESPTPSPPPPAARSGSMPETVNLKTKLGYGLGHIMNDLAASMWFTYLLLFFHRVLQFDNIYAGVILLIGQVADGLSTTFVGFFSDSGDDFYLCNRIGKRKAWHLIGSMCVVFSFPFIFLPCVDCTASHQLAQVIYYAAFVVIFQFGWASVQISHLAMIPEIASTQKERTGLTAIRYSMTVISNLLVYVVTWGFLSEKSSAENMLGPDDLPAFRNSMIVVLTVGSAASLLFHLIVKYEIVNPDAGQEQNDNQDQHQHVQLTYKEWFREPQLYQVALVYMSTRLFVNLSQAYIPLYLQVTLQLHATYVATVPLTIFISGFVTSFAMKFINDKIGRKTTFFIGSTVGLAGCLWTYFGCQEQDPNTEYYVFFVAAIIGAGGSTMLISR